MKNKKQAQKQNMALLTAAIIITSLCLRAPITCVGPIARVIKEDLSLSNAAAGLLTTIPLLVFAGLSVVIGKLAVKMGTGRCLIVFMAMLCIGLFSRSLLGSYGLFIGTVLIGAGIVAGNVLLPGIVKEHFPRRIGEMSSLYTTLLTAFGGIASGTSVLMAGVAGWRLTLMACMVFAIPAFLVWVVVRRSVTKDKESSLSYETSGSACAPPADKTADKCRGISDGDSSNIAGDASAYQGANYVQEPGDGDAKNISDLRKRRSVARSPRAWAIVFLFGIQSLVFYSFAAWLPSIMRDKGFSEAACGYFSSAFILIGIPATFAVPLIIGKLRNASLFNFLMGLAFASGMFMVIVSDTPIILITAVVLSGVAVGAFFSESMTLFALRTGSTEDAAALSGLSQSVGYLLAAIGPVAIGFIYDVSSSWVLPLAVMTALALVEAILGIIAGKDKIIQ